MSDRTDPFPIPMLTNVNADETASGYVPNNNTRQHQHSITFDGTVTAGIVVVEDKKGANLATFDASLELKNQVTLPGPGEQVRHRIDSAVVGGNVTTTMYRILMG